MKLEHQVLRAPLRAPWVSSRGSIDQVELLLVRLLGDDGIHGFGEAPAVGVDADTQRASALDLARWDLDGRRGARPVWKLLGARSSFPVDVNATIARADRAGAAEEAAQARAAGYKCVKVKVGIGDDGGRLAAVRAAGGPKMAIRIDANGAWTVPEAIASLRALAPIGIELCEEPTSGLAEIERVSADSPIPIALDESAALPGAVDRRWCAFICLKIARCGGISATIEAAARARHAGYSVYLASSLDGPLGIAAALHTAAAIRPERPCGLATLDVFADRENPLPVHAGKLAPPSGPGLGEGLERWYLP